MKPLAALRERVGALKGKLGEARVRAAIGAGSAAAVLGQTSTIDTSAMTQLIQSLLPLLVTMIGLAIPIIFFNKIMELIERLFKSFS